jgi:F0F1-type ATP synthase assembly protein I
MQTLSKGFSDGMNHLSLGISIVVAILLGIGVGLLMKNFFNQPWLLWLGVFWGVAAAIANIYKVYKNELKDYEKIAKDREEKKLKAQS